MARASLRQYARKRDFTKTAEPPPDELKAAKSARTAAKSASRSGTRPLRFVIQKHDASRLHYDFRLELDGVLKSWAVPKGPSLNPADKRLAVQVEDHPVAYGDFEGTIPEGQYGGGTVMLWDTGHWMPVDEDAAEALRRGKLTFVVDGEKLKGEWTLTRMGGRAASEGKPNWLLIKHQDAYARATGPAITESKTLSVKTGRDLDEIAGGKGRAGSAVWDSSGRNGSAATKTSKKKARGEPGRNGAAGGNRKRPPRGVEAAARLDPEPKREQRSGERGSAGVDAARVSGARPAAMPREASPQLCTLAEHVPKVEGWIHEIKFDGYRFLAHKSGREVRLMTRARKDWTERFKPIADAVAKLPMETAIIDGEATIVEASGKSSFQGLQQAIKTRRFERLVFYVFDLLYCEGFDLTRAPLLARKELLSRLVPGYSTTGVVRYSDHVTGDGNAVELNACRLGLEGVVSKRADGVYVQGRSPGWLKIKCGRRQEFIIVGYSEPRRSRSHFGSLLLGAHDEEGRLVYTGKVGTGFDEDALRDIGGRLKALERKAMPLEVTPPRAEVRGAHWVEPKLVGEVAFTEWTEDGRLRHPSFQGLREDKEARAVKIERATGVGLRAKAEEEAVKTKGRATARPPRRAAGSSAVSARGATARAAKHSPTASASGGARRRGKERVSVAGVAISNPDRVLFPEVKLTKLDLAQYHERVADLIMPHLIDRPLSTVRCPSGRGGQCFFQKHLGETFSEPVHAMRVKEKDGSADYISIDSVEGLITLVQFGVLEMHPWGSRKETLEQPDQLTFDLDPGEGVTFEDVKMGARRVREVLEEVGLESFLKTSGGKGLHVIVPLKPKADWEQAKTFAHDVARCIARREPERYLDTMSKQKRVGKIFVDYLRNGRGATSVAPYSPRARAGAPVSMPIRWEDLGALRGPDQYTVMNAAAHLGKRRKDPWARFDSLRSALTGAYLERMRELANG